MGEHTYLVAIGDIAPPKKFTELLEKFAPRWSLRQGVHVICHDVLLSIAELEQGVRETLPEGTPFFVAIPREWAFQPRGESPQEPQSFEFE